MERTLYRELWQIRFQKMLNLELQAARDYQLLIERCRSLGGNAPVIECLEGLIRDEKRHAALAKELLLILERQKD